MRVLPTVMIVVSLALMLVMMQASGIGGVLDQDPDTQIEDSVEEEAEAMGEEQTVDPDDGGGGLLGSTVSALRGIYGVFQMLVFLPGTLEQAFGAPTWFARIVGHLAQIILGLGIYQIARGTEIL